MEELQQILLLEKLQNEEQPRKLRFRQDAFELRDRQFIKLFRLNKELAAYLVNVVGQHFAEPRKSWAIDNLTKVLVALRFFASGAYQSDVGQDFNLAVSQSSVSRCVHEVADTINEHLLREWVNFPNSEENLLQITNDFYRNYNFPGVIGAIDCTHVAIVPPSTANPDILPHVYVNRKGYHSVNVQLICDSNMKILNVNARYPGSTHDALIWKNSVINPFLQRRFEENKSFWLLGDSGYPGQPWLMIPIANAQGESPEAQYNYSHIRARGIVEKCNGLLKNRFRCMLKHHVLHYSPETAAKIINACVVLHNMCIQHRVPEPEEDYDVLPDFGIYDVDNACNAGAALHPVLERFRNIQSLIVRTYFT